MVLSIIPDEDINCNFIRERPTCAKKILLLMFIKVLNCLKIYINKIKVLYVQFSESPQTSFLNVLVHPVPEYAISIPVCLYAQK